MVQFSSLFIIVFLGATATAMPLTHRSVDIAAIQANLTAEEGLVQGGAFAADLSQNAVPDAIISTDLAELQAAEPTPPADATQQLLIGQQAQKANANFATLSANSSCTGGSTACIGAAIGTCASSEFSDVGFSLQPCAAGESCFALPNNDFSGTQLVCTSASNATSIIAATGATGGVTGTPTTTTVSPNLSAAQANLAFASAAPQSAAQKLAVGQAAQQLNAQFVGLTAANATCNESGAEACLDGSFASCFSDDNVNFAFDTSSNPCSFGTNCFAVPNAAFTAPQLICTTQSDAEVQIGASGATGGIDG